MCLLCTSLNHQWRYLVGYYLKQHHTHWSSGWRPSAAAPHVTVMCPSCNNKQLVTMITLNMYHKISTWFIFITDLIRRRGIKGKPDGQQWRLGNLKHKSLYWMMLFVHDDHHHLLCIILGGKWRTSAVYTRRWETIHFLNWPQHQVMSYLLNEWLYTVKCILDILIQLWVTWHLEMNTPKTEQQY